MKTITQKIADVMNEATEKLNAIDPSFINYFYIMYQEHGQIRNFKGGNAAPPQLLYIAEYMRQQVIHGLNSAISGPQIDYSPPINKLHK